MTEDKMRILCDQLSMLLAKFPGLRFAFVTEGLESEPNKVYAITHKADIELMHRFINGMHDEIVCMKRVGDK